VHLHCCDCRTGWFLGIDVGAQAFITVFLQLKYHCLRHYLTPDTLLADRRRKYCISFLPATITRLFDCREDNPRRASRQRAVCVSTSDSSRRDTTSSSRFRL